MRLQIWLVYRFMMSGRRWLSLPALLSLIGMALGVGCLTVAMGVVGGFEKTLRTAIIDVFGDVMVVKRGERSESFEKVLAKIKMAAPEAVEFTPFLNLEGVIAAKGQLAGVMINGVDPQTVERVLNLRRRVIDGAFTFTGQFSRGRLGHGAPQSAGNASGESGASVVSVAAGEVVPESGADAGPAAALVGKSLAKRFQLKVGDVFSVVLPTPSREDTTGFSPKVKKFKLVGILDLGKVDYDERTIVTDLHSAQQFVGVGEGFTGIRMRLADSDLAPSVAGRLARDLGTQFWTMDWSEVNRNIFEAVKAERVMIFFIILVMVIAASFNISSNLFVSVLSKYSDIAILRAMGFSSRDVRRMFLMQGLFYGVVGTVLGLLLGLVLSAAFLIAQQHFVLLPAETYRIDHIGIDLRAIDVLAIVFAAILVCLVSTFIPARRGAKLDPVEGLRYE